MRNFKKAIFLLCFFVAMNAALFAQNAALPRLAVVEFSTNNNFERTKQDAITVRNLVESHMVGTRKYEIITRDDIDKLLENQRIQVSSISSAENLKKLELQNISYIITGSLDAMGNDYAITVKALDVSNGRFAHTDHDIMGNGSRDLFNGINSLMTKFAAGMSSDGEKISQTTVTGTNVSYKIGDTGPAKGIIFFDRGFVSDGWRYLEAAPAGTDYSAQWGAYEKNVSGTSSSEGSGKRNTLAIIDRLSRLGENNRAAQICAGMEINGYKDWFIPSKNELDLMYKYLKRKGLGGFKNGSYWSSSQFNNDRAWSQDFGNGSQDGYSKFRSYSVRVIRAF